MRMRFGLAGKKLALQVGRLGSVKQQALSLETLVPLLRDQPSLVLWFAGLTEDADYEAELRKLIAGSGVSAQVELLGSARMSRNCWRHRISISCPPQGRRTAWP